MDLRSSSDQNEYKLLRTILNDMGVSEEGMQMQEMRQVLEALQLSTTDCETSFQDWDMEQALRESELDFMPTQETRVLNSTMNSTNNNNAHCTSPDIPSEVINVKAQVHHPIDWSPPIEGLARQMFAFTNMAIHSQDILADSEPNIQELEADVNHSHADGSFTATIENKDADISANKSTENTSSLISNSQISTVSSNIILSPIQDRRVKDSGFMINSETPSLLFNNISTNNLEKSLPISSSVHPILGPVSVRGIHDSGVNISTEIPQVSPLSSSFESLSYSLENLSQFSSSTTISQQESNNDNEPVL